MKSKDGQRVNDPGDWRPAAGADVGGGAGDGAGGWHAAEQRRDDIGGALRKQLGCRPVRSADHPVRDDRRSKRLHAREERDYER